MTAHYKLLAFLAAFGTAITAGAQSAEPSGAAVPVIPDPNPAIMPSGDATAPGSQPSGKATAPASQPSRNAAAPATQQDRVPANRENDAVRACSGVPAADVEACIARENARKQNDTASTSSKSKGTPSSNGGKSSRPTTGGSMGSSGGDSANADAATKK